MDFGTKSCAGVGSVSRTATESKTVIIEFGEEGKNRYSSLLSIEALAVMVSGQGFNQQGGMWNLSVLRGDSGGRLLGTASTVCDCRLERSESRNILRYLV